MSFGREPTDLPIAVMAASWFVTAAGTIVVKAHFAGQRFSAFGTTVLIAFGLLVPAAILFGIRFIRIHGGRNVFFVYLAATGLDVGFVGWAPLVLKALSIG